MFEHLKKVQLERRHRQIVNKQKNLDEWYKNNPWAREYDFSGGIVGEHDEDYVFDALFDVPNTM